MLRNTPRNSHPDLLALVMAELARSENGASIEALFEPLATHVSRRTLQRRLAEGSSELALAELQELHEGNIARFRLRPPELRAWQDRARGRPRREGRAGHGI